MSGIMLCPEVAVVSGGAGAIGSATLRMLQTAGARVASIDKQAPAEPLDGCQYVEADVASFTETGRAIATIAQRDGPIRWLINNAGISRGATLWEMTEAAWDEVLDVNLKGAFNLIRHVAPSFKERRAGRIVNVASINGLRGKFGLANYSAAKAGLIGLTKAAARELGRFDVNVNAVAPGWVLTPLTQAVPQRFTDEALAETVLGRLATPEDVAGAILFLCSDLARHVTGEVLKVDGGQYI